MSVSVEYQELCQRQDVIYTSCYCEENIWKLFEWVRIHKKGVVDSDQIFAVFISNTNKTVPIWCQKGALDEFSPVVWDYHVIGIHRCPDLKKSFVYDLDTNLEFPENFQTYYSKALPRLANIRQIYQRKYRVIPCEYFLENFSSDRSHMIDPDTGEYRAEPPTYPCIECSDSKNNLNYYLNMEAKPGEARFGEIMKEKQLEDFFGFCNFDDINS